MPSPKVAVERKLRSCARRLARNRSDAEQIFAERLVALQEGHALKIRQEDMADWSDCSVMAVAKALSRARQ